MTVERTLKEVMHIPDSQRYALKLFYGKGMENGEWRMDNGEYRMDNGEWRMENGEWIMENGEILFYLNSQGMKWIENEQDNLILYIFICNKHLNMEFATNILLIVALFEVSIFLFTNSPDKISAKII